MTRPEGLRDDQWIDRLEQKIKRCEVLLKSAIPFLQNHASMTPMRDGHGCEDRILQDAIESEIGGSQNV